MVETIFDTANAKVHVHIIIVDTSSCTCGSKEICN